MYYRINMQTIFLKIFVCKLVEYHLSAILTNFFQCRRRFPYSGRAFLRFLGEDYCSTLMQRTLALSVCLIIRNNHNLIHERTVQYGGYNCSFGSERIARPGVLGV